MNADWRAKFPVNFPVSREFGPETGSQETASSTIAVTYTTIQVEPSLA